MAKLEQVVRTLFDKQIPKIWNTSERNAQCKLLFLDVSEVARVSVEVVRSPMGHLQTEFPYWLGLVTWFNQTL